MYLDGSPQGRTAWLTEPYATPPDGLPDDYLGYPAIADDQVVIDQLRTALGKGWQVLVHANGDAAIDQLIRAVEAVDAVARGRGRRVVAVHAQTARQDQIEAFRRLGIFPSFFSMHTFYWGDWYYDTVLGPPRATVISPARWALDRQMIYTSHHDAPVALPNSIAILSSQVTRLTRSGRILGPGQRVSPLDAVRVPDDQRGHPVLRAGPQGQHRGRQARRSGDPQRQPADGAAGGNQGPHGHRDH